MMPNRAFIIGRVQRLFREAKTPTHIDMAYERGNPEKNQMSICGNSAWKI